MSIEERVARLERQNRRLKQGLAAVVLVVAGAVIMGATKQTGLGETIEAQAFVVKDKSGKIRALLGVSKSSEPTLQFYDKDGKWRAILGVNKDAEPTLQFYDKDGKRRAALGVTKDDESTLRLLDKDGKQRANLGVTKNGATFLSLLDTNEINRFAVTIFKENTALVGFYNAFGKAKWEKTAR